MSNVLYLFGAGASAQALPTVIGIPERLNELIGILKQRNMSFKEDDLFTGIQPIKSKNEWSKELIRDLEWLAGNVERSASIDTYAKKLYLKEDIESLTRLKIALSIFIVCQQLLYRQDSRYDSFIASIISQPPLDFPDNIQIISWNYDFQLEIAWAEYNGTSSISTNVFKNQRLSKHQLRHPTKNSFNFLKLNGSPILANHTTKRNFEFIEDYNIPLSNSFEKILSNYAGIVSKSYDVDLMLSFAWETENSPTIVEKACTIVQDIEIMVVIGYSYPFFNREIDREVLGAMSNLKRVYIQSPDADGVIERFNAALGDDRKVTVVPKYDTTYFFLPNEM